MSAKHKAAARRPKVLCPRCGREIAQNQRRQHEDACSRKHDEKRADTIARNIADGLEAVDKVRDTAKECGISDDLLISAGLQAGLLLALSELESQEHEE